MSGGTGKIYFLPFLANMIREEGFLSLYNGLPAGLLRQVVYMTYAVLR